MFILINLKFTLGGYIVKTLETSSAKIYFLIDSDFDQAMEV